MSSNQNTNELTLFEAVHAFSLARVRGGDSVEEIAHALEVTSKHLKTGVAPYVQAAKDAEQRPC